MLRRVLLLNADYSPIDIIGWQRAIVKSIIPEKESAYVVEYHTNWIIRDSKGKKYKVPSILALKVFSPRASNSLAKYTKHNVIFRDKMCCQYCQRKFPKSELTIDHMIPKSRWSLLGKGPSASVFTNAVTACQTCNFLKANKTCQEANMFPTKKPIAPNKRVLLINKLILLENKIPNVWKSYIKGLC